MRVLWSFLLKMRVLCRYIDLNTLICGSTHIYAGIVATLHLDCSTNLIIMSSQEHVPDLGEQAEGAEGGGQQPCG